MTVGPANHGRIAVLVFVKRNREIQVRHRPGGLFRFCFGFCNMVINIGGAGCFFVPSSNWGWLFLFGEPEIHDTYPPPEIHMAPLKTTWFALFACSTPWVNSAVARTDGGPNTPHARPDGT